MRICIDPRTPLTRIVLVAALTLLLAGWTTCTAMFTFNGCQSSVAQPQITALSPNEIPADTESALLTVNGSNFVPQSQIMWNGAALPTTFVDSRALETTITAQTLASLGGAAGTTVQISVMTSGSAAGCSPTGSSASLVLVIN